MKGLLKAISWLTNSFFVGLVILIGYSILEVIFDKFDTLKNILARTLFLTVIGGIVIYVYKSRDKN